MANIYHEDSYKKEITTKIKSVFVEDGKTFAVLEDNIFYPQGGGQKGDRGTIELDQKKITVVNTIKDPHASNTALLEIVDGLTEDDAEQEVTATLNWDFRYSQMRLHTTVHYIHILIEKVLGKAIDYPITSDIQDGFAYNRYENQEITAEIVTQVKAELLKVISKAHEVTTYPDELKGDEGYRWWESNGHKIPCGGTHVANTKEVGNVEITFSQKKGTQTVKVILQES